MANLADGVYIVHNAASPYRVLDAYHNRSVNYTNIQIADANHSDAQVWEITTRRDGTRQILSRFCGKSIDVLNGKTSTVGQNIQLFTDNDSNAQQWSIVEASGTVSYNGKTYPTYYIQLNSGYIAKPASSLNEANVRVDSKTTSAISKWFFEPAEVFAVGGVYEIRSALNYNMALDVADGSTTKHANLQIFPVNHTSAQQFIVVSNPGGGYSFRNAKSGMVLDVKDSKAADGTNVQQYPLNGNGTPNQRWAVEEYGTATIGGKTCGLYRIGSYVTSSGWNYLLDVTNASTSRHTNVQIYSANGTEAQLWAFYPTSAIDSTMPVPYRLGISKTVGGGNASIPKTQDYLYPNWYCSKGWAADGTNHYEYRYRTRTMSSTSSSWRSWSSWTAWRTAPVTRSGNRSWLTQGVSASFEYSTAKAKEIEFEVRAAGTNEYALAHGESESAVFRVYKVPDIRISSVSWTPAGLRLAWTSDYDYGTSIVTVERIENTTTGDVILSRTKRFESTSTAWSSDIPQSELESWPADGDQVRVYFREGYELLAKDTSWRWRTEKAVAYDAGTASVKPTFTQDGPVCTARVRQPGSTVGETRMWVSTDDREFVECYPLSGEGTLTTTFDFPFAFGKRTHYFVAARNADGTAWGTYDDYFEEDGITAHGWSWEGGHAFLRMFQERPTATLQREAVYEANILGARKHESVSYQGATRGRITATGDLVYETDKTHSTVEDFEKLLDAGHAVYRDPYGGIRQVAVVGVTITKHKDYAEISVDMVEETR